jgi:phosphoribosylformimino-5-aminoimidazole carboxamide ribotide isomerase
MLIPSIDLQSGRIVQLVQGERLALATDDVDGWIEKLSRFPIVQVIDLDAAIGTGSNHALLQRICTALPCRVGGGVRSIARAFGTDAVDVAFASELAGAIGMDTLVAAIDSRNGRVVVRGWRASTTLTAVEAARQLQQYVGGFLYTHVDKEGLMQGTDMDAIRAVREATTRKLTAAGGITTREEIDALDRMGVDAVVGMAIYTGKLDLDRP